MCEFIAFRGVYTRVSMRWCGVSLDTSPKRVKNAITNVTVSGRCSRTHLTPFTR